MQELMQRLWPIQMYHTPYWDIGFFCLKEVFVKEGFIRHKVFLYNIPYLLENTIMIS